MRRRTATELNAIRKRIRAGYLAAGYSTMDAGMRTRKQLAILPLQTPQPLSSIKFVHRGSRDPAPAKPMWWAEKDAA